jgi:hypothetical protein
MSSRNGRDPFHGLESYRQAPDMGYDHRGIRMPVQLEIFGDDTKGRERFRRFQGYAFELFSYALFGGTVKTPQEVVHEYLGSPLLCEFDVIDRLGRRREVKSFLVDNEAKLMDHQVSRHAFYASLNPEIPIFYDLYLHNVQNIEKRDEMNLDILVSEIPENTRYFVSLPFSAVFKLWNPDTTHLSRYERKHYHFTRLTSSRLIRLVRKPREGLEELGLDPSNYIIEKRKFPRRLKLNNKTIEPFPALMIKPKSSRRCAEEFKKIDLTPYESYLPRKKNPPAKEDKDVSFDFGANVVQEEDSDETYEKVTQDTELPFE